MAPRKPRPPISYERAQEIINHGGFGQDAAEQVDKYLDRVVFPAYIEFTRSRDIPFRKADVFDYLSRHFLDREQHTAD